MFLNVTLNLIIWYSNKVAQTAGAVEYTNCFSAEGYNLPCQRVSWIFNPACLTPRVKMALGRQDMYNKQMKVCQPKWPLTKVLILENMMFLDYCLYFYCYINNVLASMSSGLLEVFVEVGNLHRTSKLHLFNQQWVLVLILFATTVYERKYSCIVERNIYYGRKSHANLHCS